MQFGGKGLILWVATEGRWTSTASIVGLFASLIALMCYKNRSPLNLVLLSVFTLIMSWMVGYICVMYAAAGYSAIILEAFAITSCIFIGLTIFTMQSKIDFSFLGLGLGAALLGLIVWGLFATLAFPSFEFSQIYAFCGAIIFSLFVVYDTWVVSARLSYDEYVLGAVNLYLDFINLFLFILRCLTGGGGSRS